MAERPTGAILPGMAQAEMPGFIRVGHQWSGDERWSAMRCRLGRFGAHSRVVPGLYALGSPEGGSALLVTSNYRLTFDLLRRDLTGLDCWILVLDTKGLGVGSAAAAGLFNTDELVTRVNASRAARLVSHRTLILPPRGASMVDAGLVARSTGFDVRIGPRRAADLARSLRGGRPDNTPEPEALPGLLDALALTPVELGRSLMQFPGFAFAALLYAGLGPGGVSLDRALAGSWQILLLGLASIACGSLLAPLLSAVFPRSPLWIAGGAAGLAVTAALLKAARFGDSMGTFLAAACWMFFPAVSAWLAARFAQAMPDSSLRHAEGKSPLLAAVAALIALLILALLVLAKTAQWRTGK